MSRLDDALERLHAALDALQTRAAGSGNRAAIDAAAEAALLRGDRDRLMLRIAALEEESRMLAGLTEEVEQRLDAAISEVRDVLGRN